MITKRYEHVREREKRVKDAYMQMAYLHIVWRDRESNSRPCALHTNALPWDHGGCFRYVVHLEHNC